MTQDNIDILSAGAAPLIAAYCREIRIPEIVNDMLRWDKTQWTITPGDLLVTMIVNLLVDRAPLYRIKDFYENKDLELLFGQGKVTLSGLNDCHYGRLLERLYEANPEHVYQSVTASAIVVHQVDLKGLHSDTTSKSVRGEYAGKGDDDELNITYGYSKDHRPDLKQFLYGLIVSEGVPVMGKIMDGNTSDKTWNREAIEELAKVLEPSIAKDMLYIADSALVSPKNLELLNNQKIKFITRLPDTYALSAELKNQAQQANDWLEVGTIAERKNAAHYRVQTINSELYGIPYRFLVAHSSSLAQTKQKTHERRITKETEELSKACVKLAQKTFACEADAKAELEAFLQQYSKAYHHINGSVLVEERTKPRKGRGRPTKGYTPEFETVWQVVCTLGELKADKIEQELRKEETFILMTNELESHNLADPDILRKYKEQISVETRFHWLKDPTVVNEVWLKNNNRVMALGFVFLMGLLVYCLLERRIRKNLASETKPIRLHGNRLTKQPTAAAFL